MELLLCIVALQVCIWINLQKRWSFILQLQSYILQLTSNILYTAQKLDVILQYVFNPISIWNFFQLYLHLYTVSYMEYTTHFPVTYILQIQNINKEY